MDAAVLEFHRRRVSARLAFGNGDLSNSGSPDVRAERDLQESVALGPNNDALAVKPRLREQRARRTRQVIPPREV